MRGTEVQIACSPCGSRIAGFCVSQASSSQTYPAWNTGAYEAKVRHTSPRKIPLRFRSLTALESTERVGLGTMTRAGGVMRLRGLSLVLAGAASALLLGVNRAQEAPAPAPAPATAAGYAGAEACATCHEDAVKGIANTTHGR